MLAHDALYPDAASLVTLIGLHDMPRFLHRQDATAANLKQAFPFLLTTRGIPMIYHGDEVGMTGGDDPDNRRDFPGGWKEDAASAFEESERSKAQEDLFPSIRLHIPLDASRTPNGTRMENLLGNTPAVEARQGALEIELPPHSAAIYR